MARVARALAESGIDPSTLELEITESVLLREGEYLQQTLDGLKELGVSLAIDDFGTGYSSLSYLKRLSAHRLKIDKSFIWALGTDVADQSIVRAVISLAHALGMEVTAEGVETADQLDYLNQISCDEGQGYFFAHPLPVGLLNELLGGAVGDSTPGKQAA